MLWAKKTKTITPIASNIERKLLESAYAKKPRNQQIFNKLIEALQHESKHDRAIELCTKHLESIAKDDYVFTALSYSYRKINDYDNAVRVGEQAIKFTPTLTIRLYLAYAYVQKKRFKHAKQIMPNDDEYSSLDITNLRFAFQILLLMQQHPEVCRLYCALPSEQQSDSGLKSSYIKSLHKSGQQAEVAKLLDHASMVKQYQLQMPTNSQRLEIVNQELTTFFSSHSKQQFEPGNHTTKLGSQMHFESDWHPLLNGLEVEIKRAVELYLNEPNILKADNKQLFSLHLWANVLTKGGHQISHIHPDASISGVYYLKVPKSIKHDFKKSDFQGCLLFSQQQSEHYYVQPSEGLLVLFPSYFYHETIPFECSEARVCIAFDVVSQNVTQ